MWGKRLLMALPLFPAGRNGQGLRIRLPFLPWNETMFSSPGSGVPSRLSSSGLWSQRSMCEAAPGQKTSAYLSFKGTWPRLACQSTRQGDGHVEREGVVEERGRLRRRGRRRAPGCGDGVVGAIEVRQQVHPRGPRVLMIDRAAVGLR